MPQPAPPARRPHPADELLEAVRSRHEDRVLKLVEAWVHRRGISDLQRFCDGQLQAGLDPEALQWFQQLLQTGDDLPPLRVAALGPWPDTAMAPAQAVIAPAPPSELTSALDPSLDQATSLSPANSHPWGSSDPMPESPEPQTATVIPLFPAAEAPCDLPNPEPATPTAVPPVSAVSEGTATAAGPAVDAASDPRLETLAASLQSRAEAAVDAAFAALAASFPEVPAEGDLAAGAPIESASSGALNRVEAGSAHHAPPTPLPPESQVWPRLSLVPTALESSAATWAEEAEVAGAEALPGHDGSGDAALEEANDLEPPHIGLRSRARLMLQGLGTRIRRQRLPRLRRLRALLRDCIEDTRALMHSDRELTSPAIEPEAPEPQAPAEATLSIPSGTQVPALSPRLVRREPPVEKPEPNKPDTPTQATTASPAPSPAVLQLVPQPEPESAPAAAIPLRQRLQGRRSELLPGRPAPAPAALAHLQAWLPDRQDLPRAS